MSQLEFFAFTKWMKIAHLDCKVGQILNFHAEAFELALKNYFLEVFDEK